MQGEDRQEETALVINRRDAKDAEFEGRTYTAKTRRTGSSERGSEIVAATAGRAEFIHNLLRSSAVRAPEMSRVFLSP